MTHREQNQARNARKAAAFTAWTAASARADAHYAINCDASSNAHVDARVAMTRWIAA